MEKLKFCIPASLVRLEFLKHLIWWALKSSNTKLSADRYSERAISILMEVLFNIIESWVEGGR